MQTSFLLSLHRIQGLHLPLSGYSIMSVRKRAPARWSARVKGPQIRPNIATFSPMSSLSIFVAFSASAIRPLSFVNSGSSSSSLYQVCVSLLQEDCS